MAGYDGTTSVIARRWWMDESGAGRRIAERERSNRALSLLYSTARRTSSAGGTDEFRWPGMLAPPAPSRAGSRSGGWTRTGREERIEKRVRYRRSEVGRGENLHDTCVDQCMVPWWGRWRGQPTINRFCYIFCLAGAATGVTLHVRSVWHI